MNVCPICEKLFMPSRRGVRYCSRICATKQWKLNNPERTKQLRRESARRHPAKDRIKSWRTKNKERVSAYQKKWATNNKANVTARVRKRQAAKLNATPAWLTTEHYSLIEAYYAAATQATALSGQPHEVDHIVPLQGKNVCGLHVPWNLRILPDFLNRAKSNHHVP